MTTFNSKLKSSILNFTQDLCNFILSDDGFEIKPKYYSLNRFLFLTRVLSLQDVFLRNMFYFIFY